MNTLKYVGQIIVLVILVVVAIILWPHLYRPQPNPNPVNQVTDFYSCQQANGEILQTDPIQCKTSDGRTFTEDVSGMPDVVLDSPHYGDLVKSPLTVVGKARGTWFFEAQMPVILKDQNGKELFHAPAHSQGDWMTTDYVPFSVDIKFDSKDAEYGVLIIQKDNPSGNPDLDSSFAIPVRFK